MREAQEKSFWVPFQLTSSSYLPLEGPPVRTFRRLAPDPHWEGAQVELTTVTQRVVLGNPETQRGSRSLGLVGAKAEWLSYPTIPRAPDLEI